MCFLCLYRTCCFSRTCLSYHIVSAPIDYTLQSQRPHLVFVFLQIAEYGLLVVASSLCIWYLHISVLVGLLMLFWHKFQKKRLLIWVGSLGFCVSAYSRGMESCCDLQVDVNGEETFMVDKVIPCSIYLPISSALSLQTLIFNGFPSFSLFGCWEVVVEQKKRKFAPLVVLFCF